MNISKLFGYLTRIIHWAQANETFVWLMGIFSVLMFFGTLITMAVIIVILPGDHFVNQGRNSKRMPIKNPAARIIYIISKNIIGFFFILAGLAMLVLPGQGLLSLLIGISLSSFPGKPRLIRAIIRQKAVLRTANWLRYKMNRPPLQVPEH